MGDRVRPRRAPGGPAAGDGAPARVLVVDDEPLLHRALARLLKAEGYTVLCAESAEEAVAILRFGGIAAVVVEVMMGGVSGTELIRWIRRHEATQCTAILAMTGIHGQTMSTRLREAGADRVLHKPLTRGDLCGPLRQLIVSRTAPRPVG